ncbi:MAG: penicillin acylase family protein [Acetobacteraceae bacterium]
MRSGFLRPLRLALASLALLLALIVAAAAGLIWLTMSTGSQKLAIGGLSAPVVIEIDQRGIPFIHAATLTDAATALGYLHARSRMFQMDLMRRLAGGRLAEMFGPIALHSDELMRTLGLARHARETFATLPKPTKEMLEAYARGVNAWIRERGRRAAPEYLVFGKPRPWTPVDSLLWGETMSLWLSGDWKRELARLELVGKLPRGRILALWPGERNPTPIDAPLAGAARKAARLLGVLPRFPGPFTEPQTASNEWALAGRLTTSGAPLLAGDPHLALAFPSLWYLVRIETPRHTLVGATAPGIPFVVLGHNRHIAWTFTDTGADTEDVFVETPAPGGRYVTPSGARPFGVRKARIAVRGHPDVVLTVRTTRHGPVVSDLAGRKGPILAVEMAGLEPNDTAATGLFALDTAQTIAEAGKAAAEISTPVLNVLVADRRHIAYFMTGRVPIRRAGDGVMPVPGASGAYDWTGFASGARLPHIVDPPSGVLVNANNRIRLPGFLTFLTRDWPGPWRARRIRALLSQGHPATAADSAAMQHDVVSTYAEQLLPVLRRIPPPPRPIAAKVLRLLDHWNGAMARNLPQPLIFNAWIRRFRALLFDRLGVPDNGAAAGPEFVAAALAHGGHSFWCNAHPATSDAPADCAPLLTIALEAAVRGLSARYGNDPASWRWGVAHPAVFADPVLSRLPLIGHVTTCRIATPGGDTTVDRGSPGPAGFTNVHGSEYRAVYDLGDLDRSRFMMAPGQAGNPFSRHACDLMRPWRDGKTFAIGAHPERVRTTIELVPRAVPAPRRPRAAGNSSPHSIKD